MANGRREVRRPRILVSKLEVHSVYLKRLDIQGFKSFANKTPLEFGPGVTCIVGPNGCGKTNVADSLRWVLGEHASRNIRARKTEDVIFAGSDKRAPLGVAEVSITLDNTNQWLPIDFADVVVSRRAYRNGENEYFINHARVRLRDVVELFQRAQVGQNSYAFMGQGMVEQALSLRPEDRRELIEEAADVRLYRVKLEDARGKLKATRENVERVRLLVREIEPRITQLERQAGRAVRHQELTRELAATLHVWFAHQWREVNEQVLAAITDQDQAAEEMERARSDAKVCEDGLAQLRAAIDERRHEISVREKRLRSVQDYVRDLERRVGLDAERSKMLAERIDELSSELLALRPELEVQQQARPVVDTAEQEAQLEAARGELAAERVRLASVEAELQELQRAALAGEQTATRTRALAAELGRRIEEARDAAARMRQERAGADEARKKIIAEIAGWAREYARLRDENAAASAALEQALGSRERAGAALERAREEHAAIADDVRALRGELAAAQTRLEMLDRMDVNPQAPDAGVRMILEAGGVIKRETVPADVELHGVHGLLGTLIRFPAELERAIEAALGENEYAIVFSRQSDVRQAVDLLLGGDSGRATLYALDSLQETRPLNLIKERGVVGVASALVRCDGKLRRLVDTVLGRVVVVEDLATAQKMVRRGLAHAIATLDGVLLRPVGSVSAGTPALIEATMAYRRDADDLPEQIAAMQPRIERREAELAEAAAGVAELESRTRELRKAIDTARDRRGGADSALAGSRAGLAGMAGRVRAIASDARRRDEAIAARLAESERMEAERDVRTREAIAAEEKEQDARRSLAELDAARAQLMDVIAEHAATVAHIDGELRAVRQANGPDIATRERLARQIEAKEAQHARLTGESQQISARTENDARELSAKQQDVASLEQELAPARQELAQFESRERTLAAELMEASAHLREAERAHMDAEHDVRIREEELETLRVSLESEGFVATADGDVEPAPQPEPEPEPADDEPGEPGDLPRWMRSEDGTDLPPVRGGSTINPTEVRDRIADLRAQIRALGPVNEQAATDYTENRERYDFLTAQLTDLSEAETQLLDAVDELERVIREKFRETFKIVNREFERYFNAFFRGGTARLELGETDEDGLPGVDIIAQPPGKKLGSMALLSGGERSLTAVALLFALLSANPSPICVLDEVDAALDEANVGRFVDELRALSERTQFVIITHNRRTIENADTIYGVSMGADSVSRVLSLRFEDVKHAE